MTAASFALTGLFVAGVCITGICAYVFLMRKVEEWVADEWAAVLGNEPTRR